MPNESEEELLKICEEVIFTINETIGVLPTNRLPASNKGTDTTLFNKLGSTKEAYISYLEQHVELLLEKQRILLDTLLAEHELEQNEIVEKIAAFAQHTKVGNCEQMACLAFVYLQSVIPDARIELVTASNHMFVVINRDKGSDITKSTTYGEHAIICDPWARRTYNANLFLVEKALYRPAAPEDIYSEGSYLKGTLALYHSYEPEQNQELQKAHGPSQ